MKLMARASALAVSRVLADGEKELYRGPVLSFIFILIIVNHIYYGKTIKSSYCNGPTFNAEE